MTGNCKDCKWWAGDEDEEMEVGECEITRRENGDFVHPETIAFIFSMCAHDACLMTFKDFGCVQFEAREIGT